MDIDWIIKIVVIIGSLGTFAAAIVAWRTLKEIKKQRIAAQKPQILFKTFTTGILEYSNTPNKIPTVWKGGNEKLENQVLFEIINGGKDLAKNIIFEYKLNVELFISLIKKNDKDDEINILYENNWLEFNSNKNIIDEIVLVKVNTGQSDKLVS